MSTEQRNQHQARDKTTLHALAVFLLVLGLLVALGGLTAELPIDRWLALASGGTLSAVAGLFIWFGGRRRLS